MITGAHSIIYSTDPEADRAFLRDVLELPFVDTGEGWLIFNLPPAEVAVHPSKRNDVHEFYLICDDIHALIAKMRSRKIACSPVENLNWGILTYLNLPGGGKLGIYEPRHARPKPMKPTPAGKKIIKRPARRQSNLKNTSRRLITFIGLESIYKGNGYER